ncbi:MAG: DUF2190 family protein [Planctomycetes bacterium]|nr:DUF2190 family protein [Planctomycetota bacterium]
MKAISYKEGKTLPYTATADVTGGAVLEVAGLAGVAMGDIADTKTDDIQVTGIVKVEKVTGAISAGDIVYYDNNGSSVGGTALTGAATTTAANGDITMGVATADAAEADGYVYVHLNVMPKVITGQTAIADPTGGTTTDAEARTAIGSIIDALEAAGILQAAT